MNNFKVGDLVKVNEDKSNKVWKIIDIPIEPPLTQEQINHHVSKYPMYLIGDPVTELGKHEVNGVNLTLIITS